MGWCRGGGHTPYWGMIIPGRHERMDCKLFCRIVCCARECAVRKYVCVREREKEKEKETERERERERVFPKTGVSGD